MVKNITQDVFDIKFSVVVSKANLVGLNVRE